MDTNIKTFVFMDCETTGLPSQENNKTRITEICFVAVESSHIQLGITPRVQNKLVFCFNPRRGIHYESSHLTGMV